jgi:hypothetical protein
MLRLCAGAVLTALVLWLGCEGRSGPTTANPATAGGSAPSVKSGFENIAKTGETGSGTMGLRQGIDQLKSTDPAKAEIASKYLKEISSLSPSQKGQIKAKAAEAAGKF